MPNDSEDNAPRRSGRAHVTLRDVAKEAGVGLGTASRALDPASRYVADDVRARVLDVAERLAYRPNISARATTTGATPTFAMLVSDIRDPYNAELVHGAINRARINGMLVTITGTDAVTDDEVRVIRMLRQQRPQALALTGTHRGSTSARRELLQELDRYQRDGGRVVIAGENDLPFDTVIVPRHAGAKALIVALAERGYRSLALVQPDADTPRTRTWLAGVQEGARTAGVRLVRTVSIPGGATQRDGGFAAAAELLASSQRGDFNAIVAATDTVALGVMAAIRAAGLTPGVDVGLAGFDDVVDADDVVPGLTSVDLALELVGRAVVDLALLAPADHRRTIELNPTVCLRGSTPPRH